MTHAEYVEYCRALFENPLFIECDYCWWIDEFINFYNTRRGLLIKIRTERIKIKWYKLYIPSDTIIYRSDFEQGGKYYRGEDE